MRNKHLMNICGLIKTLPTDDLLSILSLNTSPLLLDIVIVWAFLHFCIIHPRTRQVCKLTLPCSAACCPSHAHSHRGGAAVVLSSPQELIKHPGESLDLGKPSHFSYWHLISRARLLSCLLLDQLPWMHHIKDMMHLQAGSGTPTPQFFKLIPGKGHTYAGCPNTLSPIHLHITLTYKLYDQFLMFEKS